MTSAFVDPMYGSPISPHFHADPLLHKLFLNRAPQTVNALLLPKRLYDIHLTSGNKPDTPGMKLYEHTGPTTRCQRLPRGRHTRGGLVKQKIERSKWSDDNQRARALTNDVESREAREEETKSNRPATAFQIRDFGYASH